MSSSNAVEEFIKDSLCKEDVEKRKKCYQVVSELCDNKMPYICIFGAGYNGKRLYYELMKRLVKVDCFSDNNSEKWGIAIEDVVCVPPSYLKHDKDNMLVILAMDLGKEEVKRQMISMGMLYVVLEEELRESLSSIPTTMPLGCIEKIDYTSIESQYLIGKFNTVLRDTCAYYEDKLDTLKMELIDKN